MSSIVYGKTIQKKLYANMRGRNYVVQTRARSKMSFESLKRSADFKFRLEFLIQPSSGRLKTTCDFRISTYARAALALTKKKLKKQRSLRNEKLKAKRAS